MALCCRYIVFVCALAIAAQAAEFTPGRRVFQRGETVTLTVAGAEGDSVRFDTGGWLPAESPIVDGEAAYTLDTQSLRAQAYTISARVMRGGEPAEVVRLPVWVGQPHDDERIPVWRWGGGGADPEWWVERGFTGGFMSSLRDTVEGTGEDRAEYYAWLLDRAAMYDFELGPYLRPPDAKSLLENEENRALLPDGTRHEKVHPLAPEVLEHGRRVADTWLERLKEYRTIRHVMLNSEWQTPMSVNPFLVERAKDEIGLDITEFVTGKGRVRPVQPGEVIDGIIEDDNPRYRFLQWWWSRGHGTAVLNKQMHDEIKKHAPGLVTWHEPYRLAPVRGSHEGLDCIGTWTYGHPDIKRLCYTTYLQAAARPEDQLVQQDITLFVYGRFAIPLDESTADIANDFSGRDPFFTAGPDYAREAMWIVLSQRPDIFTFYSAGAMAPDNPTLDPFYSSPETFDAIGEVCDAVVKPYGPAILACERTEPEVAVLMSAASTWFRESPLLPGYPNEQTLPYAALLMMNHVPFEVVLDEDIEEGRLERYGVLVMPRADTLTRTMYERIRAFQDSGGKVIADESLRADLPGAVVTGYDFAYQRRIDGNTLASGQEAVTAEEHRRIMEEYAADLAAHLADVPKPARAASPRVLTNTLEGGQASYHFFVNDDRTFGPRFGQWKLRFELGVPQEAGVSVALDEGAVLYDALARSRIEYETRDGRAHFGLHLPAARGRLVAALPEAIGSVEITAPEEGQLGAPCTVSIRVLGESGKPLPCVLPLLVEVRDGLGYKTDWHRYTKTTGGERAFSFVPAVNGAPGTWTVQVTDLLAGKCAEKEINVTRAAAN